MTAATKLTAKKRRAFLKLLSETGNISQSAAGAGTTRDAVYKRKKSDSKFAEEWEGAVLVATDSLEEEARRRAFGYSEPLVYQGRQTGDHITKYSDVLLIFLLKGNNPEKFKDRVESDNTHSLDTSNVTVVFEGNGREVDEYG